MRIYTVGHGARTFDELRRLLARGRVKRVADVRRFPHSRSNPQFGLEVLSASLAEHGLDLVWFPDLGGRRRLDKSSTANLAWEVESFRAYADYLDTPDFARAFEQLLDTARERTTAIMCAELHPSRCHRRLIADKLWSLGHEVVHLVSLDRLEPHRPPPFLRVVDGHLRYDLVAR